MGAPQHAQAGAGQAVGQQPVRSLRSVLWMGLSWPGWDLQLVATGTGQTVAYKSVVNGDGWGVAPGCRGSQ